MTAKNSEEQLERDVALSWRDDNASDSDLGVAASLGVFDPEKALERGAKACELISKLIRSRGDAYEYVTRQGKKAWRAPAWQTCAAFYGLRPCIRAVNDLEEGGIVVGYRAVCDFYDEASGLIIPVGAESDCYLGETRWAKWDKWEARNGARALAQTRSISRACAMVFRYIPPLGGYHPTPAEEMELVDEIPEERPAATPSREIYASPFDRERKEIHAAPSDQERTTEKDLLGHYWLTPKGYKDALSIDVGESIEKLRSLYERNKSRHPATYTAIVNTRFSIVCSGKGGTLDGAFSLLESRPEVLREFYASLLVSERMWKDPELGLQERAQRILADNKSE